MPTWDPFRLFRWKLRRRCKWDITRRHFIPCESFCQETKNKSTAKVLYFAFFLFVFWPKTWQNVIYLLTLIYYTIFYYVSMYFLKLFYLLVLSTLLKDFFLSKINTERNVQKGCDLKIFRPIMIFPLELFHISTECVNQF